MKKKTDEMISFCSFFSALEIARKKSKKKRLGFDVDNIPRYLGGTLATYSAQL